MPNALTKTLVIPSTLADAHDAQEAIMEVVKAAGFPEESSFAVRLALDEALSNAVRHGNKLDESKKVTVEYAISATRVTISITDEGPGFEPEAVPDPTLDENLDQPHGRGLMLMKAYMTEVHYSDNGKRVTMTKMRDCPLPRKKQ